MRSMLLLIALSSGCGASSDTSDPTTAAATLASTTLHVEGMTCGSCAVTIRVAATKLDGVASVEVSYDKGTATVQYDPAKIEPAAIAKVISELGYKTSVVEG